MMEKVEMKSMLLVLCVVSAIIMLVGCESSDDDDQIEVTKGTIIQDATIVDTRDGGLTSGMTVVIDDGKIQMITKSSVHASGTAQTIDASGKYLVPGFNDMHVHAMESIDESPNQWPQLIANGVTGVREMSGSEEMIQRVAQLNTDSAAGLVDAPEILQVHGGFYGGPPVTAEAGVQFVQEKAAMGADYIKLLAGAPPFVFAVLEEAGNQGLGVAGHLPPAVSALDASNAGWQIMEHLGAGMGLAMDCATDEDNIRQSVLTDGFQLPFPFPPNFTVNPILYQANINGPFYQDIMDRYSQSKCQSLAQAFVGNETWQVPSLIRLKGMFTSTDPSFADDTNLIYLPQEILTLWEQIVQDVESTVSPEATETMRQYYDFLKNVTKLLKESGVKMLAGSDSSHYALWMNPGFALHMEFRELAESGLSPLEILQMTTLNCAEFLGRQATMGTIDEGKDADLVLLDANPVEDSANLDRIAAVFLNGKYFSREALDEMLEDVANAYQ
ncbi:MAG: amidohydrolase family protein [Deferrisomatales bacterium]|nr:amidohydrolase family protein [Deferrisomatales bacterium]